MNKKCIIPTVGLSLISAFAAVPLFVKPPKKKVKSEHGREWMSVIDDSTPISHLAIPGTHDSAAEKIYFSGIARCQYLTVLQQLEAGFRFIDLRLAVKKGKLIAVHGKTKCFDIKDGKPCDLTFESILKDLYSFLKANPTETVIISIKNEGRTDDGVFADILYSQYINVGSRYWYLGNKIPKLGDVRGRAVLLRRFSVSSADFDDTNCGLNMNGKLWGVMKKGEGYKKFPMEHMSNTTEPCTTVVLQDNFTEDTYEKWYSSVKPLIDRGRKKGETVLNFLSTTGKLFPVLNAKEMNKLFMSYISCNFSHGGITVFDFGDAEIAEKVYRQNKRHIDKNKKYPINNRKYAEYVSSLFAKYVSGYSNLMYKL